jgi:hypothetical protein
MIVNGARLALVHVIKSQKQSKVYQYDGKSRLQNIALRISPFLVLYFLLSSVHNCCLCPNIKKESIERW